MAHFPTAEEVEKHGLDVGDINVKLVEKVEELTLYTIDQEKKIHKQERKVLSWIF